MADRLHQGNWLRENESITARDGRFSLIMQDDANLVLYEMSGGRPVEALWASGTNFGFGVASGVTLQDDGNLVIYGVENPPRALWASGTNSASAVLILQNDGNLVIYEQGDEELGNALWATNTGYTPDGFKRVTARPARPAK